MYLLHQLESVTIVQHREQVLEVSVNAVKNDKISLSKLSDVF